MAMTLRIDEELEQALKELSDSEGISRQEVIKRAVLERHERAGHRSRVAAASERALKEWGPVLDRLGSV
jgi:predicted transcriptional regulator